MLKTLVAPSWRARFKDTDLFAILPLGETLVIHAPETVRRANCTGVLSLRMLSIIFLVAAFAGVSSGQALGSLSSAGDVFVGSMPAPAESTIFPGDVVRTGDNGNATFTLNGKGSIKLASGSQVVFSGDPRFLAELQSGTVVMDSFGGTTDITLRAGSFVVSPLIGADKTSSKIEKAQEGSFTITCLDGSISLIPVQGATGSVLHANQVLMISPTGELGLIQQANANSNATTNAPAAEPPPPPATPGPTSNTQKSHKGWIILGVAGGGAVAGIAAAAAGHGGKGEEGTTPVSPSSP